MEGTIENGREATLCCPPAWRRVDDGIWLVTFMHYDLGYIDLEQRTLQTNNPFGAKV